MTRWFALSEIVCFYVSMATLVVMLAQMSLAKSLGCELPGGAEVALKILLAAAVGFLTNWLAIEMLFKPYEYKRWLVIWPQGLVPRNKSEIAEKAGDKISSEFLNLKKISNRICESVSKYVHDDEFKESISKRAQNLLKEHEKAIVDFLIPEIEASLVRIVQQKATPENFRTFWRNEIEPRLTSEETNAFLLERLISGIKEHSPDIVRRIREWIRAYVHRYINQNFGGIFNLAGFPTPRIFADGLVAFIDWEMAENLIHQKLDDPETVDSIKNILISNIERFQRWMNSEESNEKLDQWAQEFRLKLSDALRLYLQDELPKLASGILMSPKLWNWINNDLLPTVRPQLEEMIREKAPQLLEQVDFKKIVSDAIEGQNVREFHQMVNDVAAEHLGAIQVLGFFLGGIIGILQCFV
ncbi:MAG: DUF445 family protein [Planctomycetia bacterium]|nr:DUF445 family protein [Planctomycetia bacterium]